MKGFGKIFVILGIGLSLISGLAYLNNVVISSQFLQGVEFLGGIVITAVGAWMWTSASDDYLTNIVYH